MRNILGCIALFKGEDISERESCYLYYKYEIISLANDNKACSDCNDNGDFEDVDNFEEAVEYLEKEQDFIIIPVEVTV
jgi:hypothetical protein